MAISVSKKASFIENTGIVNISYKLLTSPNYLQLGDWKSAEKELAFAGGAFVIAGCFSIKTKPGPPGYQANLYRWSRFYFRS